MTTVRLALLLGLITIYVSIDKYLDGAYNNYLVFAGSFHVLLDGQNLYVPHPEHYGDLFKYSPTFPLFMAPLAWLPVPLGVVCWNLINGLALYFTMVRLWAGQQRAFLVTMAILGVELVISLQHIQSNALVAALIVLTFINLERGRPAHAGFCIAAGFFLKVYGVAAGVLALAYPSRMRTIPATLGWCALLALAPLVVLSPAELIQQYRNWAGVGGTFTVTSNMSLMRVAAMYAHPGLSPLVIQIAGAVIFLLPFARVQAFPDPRFRLRLLCSLLIGLVIFNRSAEPPTYVIALAGCAIWYAAEPFRSRLDRAVMLPLLAAIVLISTDVYPREFRAFAGPWTVKTVGCLIVWLRISAELLAGRYIPSTRASADRLPLTS